MRTNRAAHVLAAFDTRARTASGNVWANMVKDATLHGCLNRVPVKAQTLASRVIVTVIELYDNPREHTTPVEAVRCYCDCLWIEGATRYQGLAAGALDRGEFLNAWRQVSDSLATHRPRLAYQCALFARNWLLAGRCRQRLADFADWLTR